MTRRTRRSSATCGERDTGLSKLKRVRFFRSLSAELLAALAVALAVAAVVVLHLWKKNVLLSIAGGTALYMVLLQVVFT